MTATLPFPIILACAAGTRDNGLLLLSDESLMARYGDGDGQAFEVLYRRHRATLHRFVRHLAPAESDELFQEVWLAVIHGRSRYQPTAKFTTYLFAIMHNKAVSRLRALKRSLEDPLGEEAEEVVAATGDDPLEALHNAELGQALLLAINKLPLAQREAFLLHAETGLSLDEIAGVTGTGRETVKSRLRYAQRSLRGALKDWH